MKVLDLKRNLVAKHSAFLNKAIVQVSKKQKNLRSKPKHKLKEQEIL